MEQLECSYTASGNTKWYSHFGKQFGCFIKNIHLPYKPAIPLLGIYPRKMKTYVHKKTCKNIYSSFIHNSCKLEMLLVFINRRINKLLYIYALKFNAVIFLKGTISNEQPSTQILVSKYHVYQVSFISFPKNQGSLEKKLILGLGFGKNESGAYC